MDFPCIDFVEECHDDKGVEDDGEVLGRRVLDVGITARVYV